MWTIQQISSNENHGLSRSFACFSLGSVFCSLKMTVFLHWTWDFCPTVSALAVFPFQISVDFVEAVDETQSALVVSNAGGSEDIHPKILGFQWDFNGFHSFGMLEIPLLCFWPSWWVIIFSQWIFSGLDFVQDINKLSPEDYVCIRMWQSHYNQSLFLGMVFHTLQVKKIAARLNRLSGVWFIELPTAFAYICRLGMFNHQMIGVDDYWWIPSPWKCLKKRCVVLGHATRM